MATGADQNEGKTVGDVVVAEVLPGFEYSRETSTITDGEDVNVGTILELSGAEYIVCTTGANAVRVAIEEANPSGTTGAAVSMVRTSIIDYANVDWGTLNAAGKLAAVAALEALGILVRTGPTYTTL